jgi:hypothetical protein
MQRGCHYPLYVRLRTDGMIRWESFPASDPIAASFTSSRAPDEVNGPNSKFQIENGRRVENEKQLIEEYGITFGGPALQYKGYHYRIFSDTPDFARLDHSNSSYQIASEDPAQWQESEKPTETEQRQMAAFAITCDGRQVLRTSRLSLLTLWHAVH